MKGVGENLLERVAETASHYRMFGPGNRVGVAVSGGADSVALLHLLHELTSRWNLHLRVLHFNHQLRGADSDADARFVEDLARHLGLAIEIGATDVAAISRAEGDNLEQAARRARYGFLRQFLDSGSLDRIAVGHTRSDQAETVLFRLLRGSGTAGLAGIRPVVHNIVRPLIREERAEIETYLRERGIEWKRDASNQDPRFDRNRIRHELLPELERNWNPALREVLARTANVAQDEEDYWEEKLDGIEAELLREEPPAMLLDCSALKKLHRAVARRTIRRAIERVKGDLRSIDALHVERLLDLALSGRGEGQTQLPGLLAVRSFEAVRLAPPGAWPTEEDYSIPVKVPGQYVLPNSKSVICLEFADGQESGDQSIGGYNTREAAILDREMIRGPLVLRNWRSGDQFQPVGNRRPRKLKALFQGERIPSWDRAGWPMLSLGGSIVWAQRFGVAAEYAAKPGCADGVRVWKSVLADGR